MKENISKLKSKIIKFVVMAVIFFVLILIFGNVNQKSQYLDNLDYNITINEDGSIRIVETWDIYINHTNTMFRNFKYSKYRQYGDIVDVSVTDLNARKELINSNEEEYHVPTGYYYALPINGGKFEIAWGTGMENKTGKKKYQVAYTITDVITEYKDSQELYWMLLNDENAIPAKKVTGTITLPQRVSDIDKLKVWGHGSLNGEINVTSKNTVKFTIKNLRPYNMLEIRVATMDKMINVQDKDRIRNYDLIPVAMREESQWATETNLNTESQRKVLLVLTIIYLIVLVYDVIRLIQAYKIFKEKNQKVKVGKIQYFRDIPRGKNSTPGEAAYLYYFNKSEFNTKQHQSNMVAGTILNLCLKKHISLRVEQNEIYIKVLSDGEELKDDELRIFKLLKKCRDGEEEFKISKLNEYAKTNYNDYADAINKFVNSARNSLYDLHLVDKNEQRQYKEAEKASTTRGILKFLLESLIVLFVLGFIPIIKSFYIRIFGIAYQTNLIEMTLILTPLIAMILAKLNILMKIKGKIAVLTLQGSQEKEEWNALVNYMKHFSKFEEKGVPDLILWEQYLVYATTFGIADEVIKQMKAKYPEVFVKEYWEGEQIQDLQYEIIELVANYPIVRGFSRSAIDSLVSTANVAYKTSMTEIATRASSSGGGSGGGFSSGGGRTEVGGGGMGGR